MIKYKLICRKCSYTFSSWFASSNEYEKLKKLKYIDCTNCNSQNVEKDLMSPNIVNSKRNKYEKIRNQKYNKIQKKLVNIKNLLNKTSIMLVKILHMKRDQFIMKIKKI